MKGKKVAYNCHDQLIYKDSKNIEVMKLLDT